jgi:HSP20 family molecular chaperone IbpA
MARPIINLAPRWRPPWVPNTDVFIDASGDLIVCLELSGIQSGDFKINTENNQLHVTGNRPSSGAASAQHVLVHEINAGPFDCALDIPPDFNLSRASSAYANGTLRITVPPVAKSSDG